jgi:hypothetical protein
MFYSTNQSYDWKLNQTEVAIYGRLSNQIVRRGVSSFTSASYSDKKLSLGFRMRIPEVVQHP